MKLHQITTERPADLIRVAVPRLNKCDWIEEYLKQLEAHDYDITWARVEETKVLSCADWNAFMHGLLTDREWLAGRGGASSWAFGDIEDRRDWCQLTEAEQDLWRKTSYLHVVAVQCAGQTVYVNPEGYNYARYMAFAAHDLPEGKSREELRREEMKRAAEQRLAETKERIANPPEVPADQGLRFLWNGVKINGTLTRCYYSMGNLVEPWPAETITVWCKGYGRLPEAIAKYFDVENNSDSQSDYFEEDRIRVCPNHPLYGLVKAAWQAQQIHEDKRLAKRAQKWGSIDA